MSCFSNGTTSRRETSSCMTSCIDAGAQTRIMSRTRLAPNHSCKQDWSSRNLPMLRTLSSLQREGEREREREVEREVGID